MAKTTENKKLDLLPAEDELLKKLGYQMIDKLDGEAIGNAIETLARGEATYEIRFKTKKGIKYVRGIGWEGAKAMLMVIRSYEQHKGVQIVPDFEISEWPDIKFVNGQVVAVLKVSIWGGRLQWHVVGQSSIYDDKGRRDPLAVTKAVSKAERNAILSVIPKVIKEGLIDYLSRKYGVKVVETEAEILEETTEQNVGVTEHEDLPMPTGDQEDEFEKRVKFWPKTMWDQWERNFKANPSSTLKAMKRFVVEYQELVKSNPDKPISETPYKFRWARMVEKAKELDEKGIQPTPDVLPDDIAAKYFDFDKRWEDIIVRMENATLKEIEEINEVMKKLLKSKGEEVK